MHTKFQVRSFFPSSDNWGAKKLGSPCHSVDMPTLSSPKLVNGFLFGWILFMHSMYLCIIRLVNLVLPIVPNLKSVRLALPSSELIWGSQITWSSPWLCHTLFIPNRICLQPTIPCALGFPTVCICTYICICCSHNFGTIDELTSNVKP